MQHEDKRGCYSITYRDPGDDCIFAADYGNGKENKNRWTCSETLDGLINFNWRDVHGFPDHWYRSILDHFGLNTTELSIQQVRETEISPADLVRLRRAKEERYGLARKEMMNMRIGCPKGELADFFEAMK